MTYEEFKREVRVYYPTLSCRAIRELYALDYPTHLDTPDTIADTPPPQPIKDNSGWWVKQIKQKEEGINPMIHDECDMCVPCAPAPRKGFKAKATMANAQIINAAPVEATQRDYAIERIKALGEEYAQALRTKFNMDKVHPQTFLELEALIKNGEYTVTDRAREDDACLYNLFYGVHLGKPKDEAGYKAAKEVLEAAAQKALDGATLKPINQLEAVIDGFEAWTPDMVTLHAA